MDTSNSLDSLALILQRTNSSKDYKALRKAMHGYIGYVRNRFQAGFVKDIDFNSVIDLALMKAVRNFDSEKGAFGPYAQLWMMEYVKRELVKMSNPVALPVRLTMIYSSMTDEDRKHLILGTDKERIMEQYELSEVDYDNITYVDLSTVKQTDADVELEFGTRQDYDKPFLLDGIEELLDVEGQRFKDIILASFGFIETDRDIRGTLKELGHENVTYNQISQSRKRLLLKWQHSNKAKSLHRDFIEGDS